MPTKGTRLGPLPCTSHLCHPSCRLPRTAAGGAFPLFTFLALSCPSQPGPQSPLTGPPSVCSFCTAHTVQVSGRDRHITNVHCMADECCCPSLESTHPTLLTRLSVLSPRALPSTAHLHNNYFFFRRLYNAFLWLIKASVSAD